MEFYVAGKLEEREKIREIQNFLRDKGHSITEDWTYHECDDPCYPEKYAIDDFYGASNCDIYVGIFKKDYNYKGALVELGIALGSGKRIIIVGHAIDSCIFMSLPFIIQFNDIQEFFDYISRNLE